MQGKKHPKNDELGMRLIIQHKEVYIHQEDAQIVKKGDQIALLNWGCISIDNLTKDKSGNVTEVVGKLNPKGSAKKELSWVPKLEDQVTPVLLREFDNVVTKDK